MSLPNPPGKDREQSSKPLSDPHAEMIWKSLDTLYDEGAVIELRAFGRLHNESGYFDDHDALVKEAVSLDRCGFQCYVVMNEVDPALLARATNRTVADPERATTDRDIVRRRWLLVDVDPVRPSGTSASRAEKAAAKAQAQDIARFLCDEGWPDPVAADSGNGYHLLYKVDLPNDDESRQLVKAILQALASEFDDDQVKIDTSVHNAARIVRLYGTLTRKGTQTPDRPHRRSRILKIIKKETN